MNRVLNKVEALAKGRKVKCTVSILNAKLADVQEYRKKYGKKAIYVKNGKEYVKPFIRTRANTQKDLLNG